MKIELTLAQFQILKDLVEMSKHINSQTSIKYDCKVDGWHGSGRVTFNRHEYEAKIRFFIAEVEK